MTRLKLCLRGAVQGVGFRPFVFRLARELQLRGWVSNSLEGVIIELEGAPEGLKEFERRLPLEKPAHSSIQTLETSWLDPVGYEDFQVRESGTSGSITALVMADLATCADCRNEIFDPSNRRHFYPFTNCTNCGPRFSIIEKLPYDRANTSMRAFAMCPQCEAEYRNPQERRFHAQPNACPLCGPHLEIWNPDGEVIASSSAAQCGAALAPAEQTQKVLRLTAEAILSGRIVAVKGLGGFHLVVSAGDNSAVARLRERKHREEKPFALMFPALEDIQDCCEMSPEEARLLQSSEAPIVLLRKRGGKPFSKQPFIAENIAPGNPYLGVMLPYTPSHHLLMAQIGVPIVATSGNLADEPICTDEGEALTRLRGIADLLLVHNRPIIRHVDDSIVRIALGREMVLRRARGYAPLPVQLGQPSVREAGKKIPTCGILAVGAHLKNAVALSSENNVFISQHIGDLETEQAHGAFKRVVEDLQQLYGVTPQLVVADAHPNYLSTSFAHQFVQNQTKGADIAFKFPRLLTMQHHLAHVYSCMAENELEAPVLGIAWDGTGYGLDSTIWGGEFFEIGKDRDCRIAKLRPFPLLGGERAVKEPRRAALGLLLAAYGSGILNQRDIAPIREFTEPELQVLVRLAQTSLNSPLTSSVGRLFDVVSSLTNLRQRTAFEGQAAMQLEFAALASSTTASYSVAHRALDPAGAKHDLNGRQEFVFDWEPMLAGVLSDLRSSVGIPHIARKFHNWLAEMIVEAARLTGIPKVALSGGCFQNTCLLERAVTRLKEEGFSPYWQQRVPPNDGGICLGQIAAARKQSRALAPGQFRFASGLTSNR